MPNCDPAPSSHPIRLAGPWQRSIVGPPSIGDKSQAATCPSNWVTPSIRVTLPDERPIPPVNDEAWLAYRRPFNRPPLRADQVWWVEISAVVGAELPIGLVVELNGIPVEGSPMDDGQTHHRWVGQLPSVSATGCQLRLTYPIALHATDPPRLRTNIRLLIEP